MIRLPRDTEHLSPEAFIVEVAKALSEDKGKSDIPKDFADPCPSGHHQRTADRSGKTAVTAALLLAPKNEAVARKRLRSGQMRLILHRR